jgi:hypothetical protein
MVGRTLLQIFITTTLNHRLNCLSSDRVARGVSRFFGAKNIQRRGVPLAFVHHPSARAVQTTQQIHHLHNLRAVHPAQNNVTTWGRLDVKIAERRVALPNGQILNWVARVLGDFYQRDAPRRVQRSGAHG